MKKVLKLILSVTLLFALAAAFSACRADDPAPVAPADPGPAAPAPGVEVQIALVAHSPDSILDDGSFNQGAWAGIQQFLRSNNLPAGNANFFQPHEGSDAARIDLIHEAIGAGANIVILPGFHFEGALYDIVVQDLFPDTKFVLLDASPQREGNVQFAPNVAGIHYAEHEAGFLAGYAAVQEGHRNLGFMGGIAVPAVVRFGHGFVQGAEHAASELGLGAGDVSINFTYLGAFAPSPERQAMAAAWFAAGTDVIFAAAGGAGGSVMAAAEAAGGLVIGVDVDQAHMSATVITSAMKALDVSVYDMITDFVNNRFRSGRIDYSAANNGVGLPGGGSWRFSSFTQAQYDAVFAQLAGGAVSVNASLEMSDILGAISLVTVSEM